MTATPNYGKRMLVGALVSAMIVGGSILIGADAQEVYAQSQPASDAPFSFEVASIRPSPPPPFSMSGINRTDHGRFAATQMSLKGLVTYVYGAKLGTVSGGPAWVDSDRFDINAKIEDSVADALNKLPEKERNDRMKLMLLSLLEDRFKLKVRRETKERPVYALVVARSGTKLTPNPASSASDGTAKHAAFIRFYRDHWAAKNVTMSFLADELAYQPDVGRVVVDATGLKDEYDFDLTFAPSSQEDSGPLVFTALEEQLGLKLEPSKAPLETFAIESVERPSEN